MLSITTDYVTSFLTEQAYWQYPVVCSEQSNITVLNKILYSVLLTCVVAGCAGKQPAEASIATDRGKSPTAQKLYSQYNSWRGVKYREGGLSKKGVDCSGFVYLTYQQQFNRTLPRTTEQLSSIGQSVNRKKLQAGDLVFFKTGWKVRHVGIYLGNSEFVHASSSRGVRISNLNNPYWADAYWMSRRP